MSGISAHPAVYRRARRRAIGSLLSAAAVWAASGAWAADGSAAERPVVEVGTVSVRPVSIESWICGSRT